MKPVATFTALHELTAHPTRDHVPIPVTTDDGGRSIRVAEVRERDALVRLPLAVPAAGSQGAPVSGMQPERKPVQWSQPVSALAVAAWERCRVVAGSMPVADGIDREGIVSDAFLGLAGRVMSAGDGLTWENVGRADVRHAVVDAVKREWRVRGDLYGDRFGPGDMSDDTVGHALHAETSRQAFANMARDAVNRLADNDPHVLAYVLDVMGRHAVPDTIVDACMQGEHAVRDIRAASRRLHNERVEPIGRARGAVKRGKATRRQRAAVAVADVLASFGFFPDETPPRAVREPVKPARAVPVKSEPVTLYRLADAPALETGVDRWPYLWTWGEYAPEHDRHVVR